MKNSDFSPYDDVIGGMRVAALTMFLSALIFLGLIFAWAGSALAAGPTVDEGDVVVVGEAPDVAAPFTLDLERGETQRAPTDLVVGPVTLPSERRGDTLMAIALFLAVVLRGATGLLRSGVVGVWWGALPKWGQWVVLGALTAALAGCDALATGVGWKSALSTALTALFMSFVSQKAQKAEAVAKGGAR